MQGQRKLALLFVGFPSRRQFFTLKRFASGGILSLASPKGSIQSWKAQEASSNSRRLNCMDVIHKRLPGRSDKAGVKQL
jgi:hypothetical protein